MKCEKAQRMISSYVDGELSHLSRWRLQRHLRRCSSCREYLQEEMSLKKIMEVLPVETVTSEFKKSFTEKWLKERERELVSLTSSPWVKWTLAGVLTVVLLVTGGTALYVTLERSREVNEQELYLNLELFENLDVILYLQRQGGDL